MKLNKDPFDKMKSGKKIIEIRLYDDKRQQINIGDSIVFTKLPNNKETLTVEVVGLFRYPKIADLVSDFNMAYFGYPSNYDKDEFTNSIYSIYTPEQENEHGILGIKVKA